jgi:hypothetical protein
VAVALLACTCALLASAVTALGATPPPRESLVTFEGQLHGHQVSAATLRTKVHILHVSLRDGRKALVALPSAQQQRVLGEIGAEGVAVKVVEAKPPSHKRRYIAGGAVIVVVVLGVAVWLMRRRRTREA